MHKNEKPEEIGPDQSVSILALLILEYMILCCGGCLVHYIMYNSSPSLYALDVSGIFGRCDNQKCLPTLPNVFWGTKSPLSV